MLAQMLAKALVDLPIFQAILSMLGLGGGGLDFGPGGLPDLGTGILSFPPLVSPSGNPLTVGGGSGSGSTALASIMSSPAIAGAMSSAMSPSGGGGSAGSGSYGRFSGGSGGGFASPDAASSGGGWLGNIGQGSSNAPASGGSAGVGSVGYQPYGGASSGAGMSLLSGMLAKSGLGGLGLAGAGGGLIGQTLFGGKGFADIGGALGALGMTAAGGLALSGLAGGFGPGILALMSNPLGIGLIVGAALLGAFGGSLFGDHFSQADEPDIYQNQAWGQANADMMGSTSGNPMNANGKAFTMDSQTIQATNGSGWNLMMEQFVGKFRSNVTQLPPDLQEAFPKIEQLWGGATNQKQFNPDGKDGYLDIGSGQRALWSDFWSVVQTYGQSISSIMQEYSPVDTYLSSVNGTVTQVGSTSMGGGSGFGSPFAMGSPSGGGSGANSNAIAAGGPGRLSGGGVAPIVNINLGRNMSTPLIPTAQMVSSIKDAVTSALGDDAMQGLQR
jgi:hypothetical protein